MSPPTYLYPWPSQNTLSSEVCFSVKLFVLAIFVRSYPCQHNYVCLPSAKLVVCACVQAPPVIHTPHALPMFKAPNQIRKRKSEKDRDDAVKFHKPEAGSSAATLGRGAAGLIGKTGGTLLTQYILKNHVSTCSIARLLPGTLYGRKAFALVQLCFALALLIPFGRPGAPASA